MRRYWDGERMDCLLLLAMTTTSTGYAGRGDFAMDPNGLLSRRDEAGVVPFVFAGVSIMHPRLFNERAGRWSVLAQCCCGTVRSQLSGSTACASKASGCTSARRWASPKPKPRSAEADRA